MAWNDMASGLEPYSRVALPVITALLALILVSILVFRANKPVQNTKVSSTSDPGKKIFSRVEVSKHTQANDAWIILKGKVFDVTPYVQEHPGGEAILRNAGGDASDGFYGPQHPERVFDLIDDFYIGELEAW